MMEGLETSVGVGELLAGALETKNDEARIPAKASMWNDALSIWLYLLTGSFWRKSEAPFKAGGALPS